MFSEVTHEKSNFEELEEASMPIPKNALSEFLGIELVLYTQRHCWPVKPYLDSCRKCKGSFQWDGGLSDMS